MFKKSVLLGAFVLATFSANAVELVKWERIPLTVKLNTDQERIIFVNKNVRVGFPPELTNKLRVQSTGGAVYLQSSVEFPTARLQLQDVETGEIILLDVMSEKGTKTFEPMSIIYNGDLETATSADVVNYADETKSSEKPAVNNLPSVPIPIALTRYAAQNLYGPIRTIEALPGVSPASVPLPKKITTLLPTENVEITPLAAWKLRNNFVVALKIVNKGNQKVVLDPRRLHGNGKFVSASFQHRFLGERGTPEDTTTVYIVTDGRIDNAFIPEPKKIRQGKK